MLLDRKAQTEPEDESNEIDSARKPRRLRLAHRAGSDGFKPSKSAPYAWSLVVATQRREQAIEGMLVGCAIADAISVNRNDLHPRVALKLFGRPPLQFRFQPGIGVTSHRTHSMIMTIQAMLKSRTDKNRFASQLKKRIAWYQRAFPLRHFARHASAFLTGVRNHFVDDSLSTGFADDPLLRSIVVSIMLQGCTDSTSRWFQNCIEVSHTDPRVLHAGVLVGYAAQIAQVLDADQFDALDVLERLQNSSDEPNLNQMLSRFKEFLTEQRSVAFVAKQFGWENGIPSDLMAQAVMGLYAWLRHHSNYRNCVERSAMLGGACGGAAVVAGTLCGIHLGKSAIPEEWKERISLFPYNHQWREELIDRVKDWPHGVEDIQRAKGVPSMFGGQLLRNLSNSMFQVIHTLIRLPLRLTQFSVRKRSQFK